MMTKLLTLEFHEGFKNSNFFLNKLKIQSDFATNFESN